MKKKVTPQSAPKMTERSIYDYTPDDHNANKGNERGLQMIENSLRRNGVGRSIVADKNGKIPAGNKTTEAAINAGITKVIEIETDGDAIIVHRRRDWDLNDVNGPARQYAHEDNRISEVSYTPDADIIAVDIAAGVDLSFVYTQPELDYLLGVGSSNNVIGDSGAQINRADELLQVWQVKRGQLWVIPSKSCKGKHRLLCGDCTNADDVARVMGGECAELGLTDPPYGVKMDKGFEGFEGFGGFGTPIARRQYADDWDQERPTAEAFNLIIGQSKQSIIWGGNFFADLLPQSAHWLVWDKMNTMPTFGDCELAWTNIDRKSVKKYTVQYNGLIGKEKERFHPTQKPVALMVAVINDYAESNQTVFDAYFGSGTTLVACEQTGRLGRGLELEPKYCAVILQRMKDIGLEPQLIE